VSFKATTLKGWFKEGNFELIEKFNEVQQITKVKFGEDRSWTMEQKKNSILECLFIDGRLSGQQVYYFFLL